MVSVVCFVTAKIPNPPFDIVFIHQSLFKGQQTNITALTADDYRFGIDVEISVNYSTLNDTDITTDDLFNFQQHFEDLLADLNLTDNVRIHNDIHCRIDSKWISINLTFCAETKSTLDVMAEYIATDGFSEDLQCNTHSLSLSLCPSIGNPCTN